MHPSRFLPITAWRTASLTAGLLFATLAGATSPSPAGLWRTIDDTTGKPRGEIRIVVADGVAQGRIVRSLVPGEDPDKRCEKCPGERRGQRLVGMTILTGLKPESGDSLRWDGGELLDPDSGSVYRARLELAPDCKTMDVRGFVGIALFGRSQIWQRVE
jgi:uncharacterized protein (DUF2147 family)